MADTDLIHPLYLDVQMMFSFLAHIQGGVTVSGEGVWTTSGSAESQGKASGKLRLPFLAPMLGVEAAAEGSTAKKESDSTEHKAAWHHTAASLFNGLYSYLHEDGKVSSISSPQDLNELKVGRLVELEGEYLGNPFEAMLALANQFAAYRDAGLTERPEPPSKNPNRSGNPAVRANAKKPTTPEELQARAEQAAQDYGMRIALQMGEEFRSSPVHDILLSTDNTLRVVVTAASEYFSDATREFLRSGTFRVIGKLTRILAGDDQINMTRRTIVGAAGSDIAREMIRNFTTLGNIYSADPDPIVTAPAVQILPMAIFI